MGWAEGTSLAVALIAAATSVAAAISARRSADDIDRRRHTIASLDREMTTFNDAYARFVAAAGVVKGSAGVREFMFAAQPLLVHPRADLSVREPAVAVTNTVSAIVHRGSDGSTLTDEMARLSQAVRGANRRLAQERAEAVAATRRAALWPRFGPGLGPRRPGG